MPRTACENSDSYEVGGVDDLETMRIRVAAARMGRALEERVGVVRADHRALLGAGLVVASALGCDVRGLAASGWEALHDGAGAFLRSGGARRAACSGDDVNSPGGWEPPPGSAQAGSRSPAQWLAAVSSAFDSCDPSASSDDGAASRVAECASELAGIATGGDRMVDVMSLVFAERSRARGKADAGQVFTPRHIAGFLCGLAGVSPGDVVVDAACGAGSILAAAVNASAPTGDGREGNGADDAGAAARGIVLGVELDRSVHALACAGLLLEHVRRRRLGLPGLRAGAVAYDARSPGVLEAIRELRPNRVVMNPPYEKRHGCYAIIEGVLDAAAPGASCVFLLPTWKLENATAAWKRRVLGGHRLDVVVRLPDQLFPSLGGRRIDVSAFVFRAHEPQGGHRVFACCFEDDGHQQVGQSGRHDVDGAWAGILEHWLCVVRERGGDESCQWFSAGESLAYRVPVGDFTVSARDLVEAVFDFEAHSRGLTANGLRGLMVSRTESRLLEDGE